jgi:hypothetical protein
MKTYPLESEASGEVTPTREQIKLKLPQLRDVPKDVSESTPRSIQSVDALDIQRQTKSIQNLA